MEGQVAGDSMEIFSLVRGIFLKSIIDPVFQEEKMLNFSYVSIYFYQGHRSSRRENIILLGIVICLMSSLCSLQKIRKPPLMHLTVPSHFPFLLV